MAARRRSPRRPLNRLASRSPLHAFAAWLLRSALIGVIFLIVWLLISNWAVPSLVDGLRQ